MIRVTFNFIGTMTIIQLYCAVVDIDWKGNLNFYHYGEYYLNAGNSQPFRSIKASDFSYTVSGTGRY